MLQYDDNLVRHPPLHKLNAGRCPGACSGQRAWSTVVDTLPRVQYRRSLTAIKWQALKLAGHRKATTVFPLAHTLLQVAGYAYKFPDELADRLGTLRRALVLIGKAFYCAGPEDVRRLAASADRLYPRLFAALQGLGSTAPNLRVPPPPLQARCSLLRRRVCRRGATS